MAVEVTTRRTKVDVVAFVKNLLETVHSPAVTVPLLWDNLNALFRKTFVDVWERQRRRRMRRNAPDNALPQQNGHSAKSRDGRRRGTPQGEGSNGNSQARTALGN